MSQLSVRIEPSGARQPAEGCPEGVSAVGRHEANVVLEQAARFGAAAASVFALRFARGQQAVHLGGADRAELFAHFGRQLAVLGLVVRQPQLQHGHQALAAGLLGHLPDAPEHLNNFITILGRPPFAHGGITAPAGARSQQLDGVLAAVTELLAQLVNHARAALPPTPHIPLPQTRQHLSSDFLTHEHRLGLPVSFFLSQRPFQLHPAFIPQVSKLMRQQGHSGVKMPDCVIFDS
jgi:hypothetical protein